MPELLRLSDADIAARLDRLIDTPWSWKPEDLDAYMAGFGYSLKDKDDLSARYVSEALGDRTDVAVLNEQGDQVEELRRYFTALADQDDPAQTTVVEAVYKRVKAHLERRLGKPEPEYPRGVEPWEAHGLEDRYTWHRLPNGKDILVPRGVDPCKPIKVPGKARWTTPDGRPLELSLLKSKIAFSLTQRVAPKPLVVNGVALMWDGTDTAPEPDAQALSPSRVQSELLAALQAGPWPADRAQLHDLLTRMEFEFQMDLFNRESWSKDEFRDEDDFLGTMRRMVLRTYPETGQLELSTCVALDDVLAKKRKGPPFKGMEQAFDNALAHARTVLGPPTHQSASAELGTSDEPTALRLAQWRRDPVTVSLRLYYDGPDQAVGIDWLVEPDVTATRESSPLEPA